LVWEKNKGYKYQKPQKMTKEEFNRYAKKYIGGEKI
jgi:hypothetical protein